MLTNIRIMDENYKNFKIVNNEPIVRLNKVVKTKGADTLRR